MFKALLVEDNATFRQATKNMLLARFPYLYITEAENAIKAMDEMIYNCPELVLMDIRLPGKNGLELTKEIKSLYPDVVVIIFTNYDFPQYREAAKEAGADAFFVKGTTKVNEILTSINSLIHNR
ncbi:MAG: response regulator transcription factor [Thermodesulfobacteriota bacterium]|nr:response regulator transcription factor [Thermodesulfobacteriota bacterium]